MRPTADIVSGMRTTIQIVLATLRETFLSRAELRLENLALRQQLAGLCQTNANQVEIMILSIS